MPTVFEQGRAAAVYHRPSSADMTGAWSSRGAQKGIASQLFNTSDDKALEQAAKLLRVIPCCGQSRVLVSPPFKGTRAVPHPREVKKRLGVEMVAIADGRYDEVMATVDNAAAEARAQKWMKQAKRIVEPTREDVVKAGRASLTLDG